jgi:uncharacterized protein YfaP (DUF2135 family)
MKTDHTKTRATPARPSGWILRRGVACAALALCAVSGIARADGVEITAPLNGWRNSAGDEARYTQEVHYPAVSVNTPEGQSVNALISGRIKGAPKAKPRGSVGTLIVNGTPLPQRIEEDGTFSRSYAFGAGSNSVEMRAGGASSRLQFYDAYAGKTHARLRIVLAWDSDGTDLDLHVVSPDGAHTFYGERVSPSGGALDVDVTTGYGPEIFSSAAPLPGAYLVYVNYYGSGEQESVITTAQITVITDEGTPNEKSETIRVPMRKPGELTLVKRFAMAP